MDNLRPEHYKKAFKSECKDLIEKSVSDFESFLIGNIIKYVYRYDNKGGLSDLLKAEVYMNWLGVDEFPRMRDSYYDYLEYLEEYITYDDQFINYLQLTIINNLSSLKDDRSRVKFTEAKVCLDYLISLVEIQEDERADTLEKIKKKVKEKANEYYDYMHDNTGLQTYDEG